ncbi:MAG TPA: hypothetical protein VGQ33_04245, partial [Vicinamibacteria bacterium]|nr:hypothetical protein [Vicinamibacteria bacterium]
MQRRLETVDVMRLLASRRAGALRAAPPPCHAPTARGYCRPDSLPLPEDPMRSRHALAALILPGLLFLLHPGLGAEEPARVVALHCGRLIDGRHGPSAEDVTIVVEGDRIKQVGHGVTDPSGASVIDLSRSTCLPGLIDDHTHILLQGDITATEYDDQLLKESIPYRAIRATMAARTALEHGFTTMRDLETEGAMYAD